MNEKALKWIRAAGIRALKTMAQTAIYYTSNSV